MVCSVIERGSEPLASESRMGKSLKLKDGAEVIKCKASMSDETGRRLFDKDLQDDCDAEKLQKYKHTSKKRAKYKLETIHFHE